MRLWYLIPIAGAVVAGLLAVQTVFNSSPKTSTADISDATIKDIMDTMMDPSADFVFSAVQTISDANGVTEKQPKTDAEWNEVRRHLGILSEAQRLITQEGRKAGRPEDKSNNPQIENGPEEVDRLIQNDRSDFLDRAKRLDDAVGVATKAVDRRDKTAFVNALTTVDKACESCHLRYFYPNDSRAQLAAREEGVVD